MIINYYFMLGIYIHIPFCVKKCNYCDFCSFSMNQFSSGFSSQYIKALVKEILDSPADLQKEKVDSVYIGGGTPSILKSGQIEEILETLNKKFYVEKNAEITIEANPGTVNKEKLQALKRMGIDRLSLGIQSLNDNNLKTLGRIHNSKAAIETYELCRNLNFGSINLDFIFAIPGQTLKGWMEEANRITKLAPDHVSTYCLTPEPETPLGDSILEGITEEMHEVDVVEIMNSTHQFFEDAGYSHYEISNYSKPGHESRHNLKYWQLENFLGFGISAYSYKDGWRFGNTDDLEEYIGIVQQNGRPVKFAEKLCVNRQMGEFVMMALRTARGVETGKFKTRFDKNLNEVFPDQFQHLLEKGWLQEITEGAMTRYCIPWSYFAIQNEIAGEFIV